MDLIWVDLIGTDWIRLLDFQCRSTSHPAETFSIPSMVIFSTGVTLRVISAINDFVTYIYQSSEVYTFGLVLDASYYYQFLENVYL